MTTRCSTFAATATPLRSRRHSAPSVHRSRSFVSTRHACDTCTVPRCSCCAPTCISPGVAMDRPWTRLGLLHWPPVTGRRRARQLEDASAGLRVIPTGHGDLDPDCREAEREYHAEVSSRALQWAAEKQRMALASAGPRGESWPNITLGRYSCARQT